MNDNLASTSSVDRAKHTPGPWHIGHEGEIYGPDTSGTMQYAEIIPADVGLSDADTRLIASAPDLLAALQEIAKNLDSFREDGIRPDEWLLKEWSDKARAAIVKATG